MPDLNSVPPSPHSLAALPRRTSSQQMPPPPVPGSPSLNILPSNQSTVNASAASSSLPSPGLPLTAPTSGPPMGDNTGVGPGPGPLRHPRPLTAADLHLQLEKEQEAVVNRLTRELSILRAAQNASVASNASSTSASASGTEPGQWGDLSQPSLGTNHYQPVRHQRTPSSASARSLTANAGTVSAASLAGVSSPAPIRPIAQQQQAPIAIGGVSLSRQNSSASRRSRAGSPSPAPHSLSGSYPHHGYHEPGSLPGYFTARVAPTRTQSGTSTSASALPTPVSTTTTTTTTTSELSPSILPATSRFEETALRRAELEEYKRENEALRRRVRELERLVREATLLKEAAGGVSQQQGQQREQREQQEGETAVVVGAARQRAISAASASGSSAVGVGVPEEEVRVGESAASAAAGGGRGRGRTRE
ncbi:hypothetical protein P885DRAFT_68235 [Corynascus similis CBS 632.67]